MPENGWVWDASSMVDTGYIRRIYNCFEESALEMALSLHVALRTSFQDDSDVEVDANGDGGRNDQGHGGEFRPHLTALTIDDPRGELFLRQLMAVGYDQGVRIQCDDVGSDGMDLRFNPLAVSLLLAKYIEKERHHLAILGCQGGDGDNRQTGLLLAERLDWPCIRGVSAIAAVGKGGTVQADEKKSHRTESNPDFIPHQDLNSQPLPTGEKSQYLKVTSQIDGATLIQTVRLPVVLIVGHAPHTPYLRIPTLKQKLSAKKRVMTTLSPNDLSIDPGQLSQNDKKLMDLQRPQSDSSCTFLKEATPHDQARALYDRYLKGRIAL